MFDPQNLSCPIIRPARSEDAPFIANILLQKEFYLFNSVYRGNIKGAKQLLINQYSKHFHGVHVLQEGEEVIGVMKIHLPGVKMGKTVSFPSLIKNLGLLKGIRAALLLSNWDEYKLSPGEAYVEFLQVHETWKGFGCEKILYEKAQELALSFNATYLTKYIGIRDYMGKSQVERMDFDMRRKIHSPIAKLLGEVGTWRKYTFTLINGPITVKEFVVDKLQTMKLNWQIRRRESMAALKTSVVLTTIPVVGGSLAYLRGYPIAAIGWLIIFGFHVGGGILIIQNIFVGKYVVGLAMISESINLIMRALMTPVWFDRGWLLPLALTNVWVIMSLFNNPSKKELIMIEDTTLVHYQDILSKAKYH